MASLELTGISHSYLVEGQRLQVLKGVNLKLFSGEIVCIIGKSGSGKSTLMSIAGLLLRPQEGKVLLSGTEASCWGDEAARLRSKSLGFIHQNHFLLSDLTAEENVSLPLMIQGMSAKLATDKAAQTLSELNLCTRLKHLPCQMSGGERQRVAVARAIITRPSVVLADEPTGNLNKDQALEVFSILRNLAKKHGICCMVVTHDADLTKLANRVYLMEDGKLH